MLMKVRTGPRIPSHATVLRMYLYIEQAVLRQLRALEHERRLGQVVARSY